MQKLRDYIVVFIIIIMSFVIFICKNRIIQIGNWGYFGVFILCFLSNLSVFIPAPSILVAISCSQILMPLYVVLIGAAGSALGEYSGYIFGKSICNVVGKYKDLLNLLSDRIRNIYLLIFIFAFIPLPLFDFIGIYSGGRRVNAILFFVSCYAGKFMKMMFYVFIVNNYILNYSG